MKKVSTFLLALAASLAAARWPRAKAEVRTTLNPVPRRAQEEKTRAGDGEGADDAGMMEAGARSMDRDRRELPKSEKRHSESGLVLSRTWIEKHNVLRMSVG